MKQRRLQHKRAPLWRALRLHHLGVVYLGNMFLAIAIHFGTHVKSAFSHLLVTVGLTETWFEVSSLPFTMTLGSWLVGGGICMLLQFFGVVLGWKLSRLKVRIGARVFLRGWVLASSWSAPILFLAVVILDCAVILICTGSSTLYSDFFEAPIVFLYLLTAPTAYSILLVRRRARRLWFVRCENCDYILQGNVSGTCPECGTMIVSK